MGPFYPIGGPLPAAVIRQQAEILMERASQVTGAAAILPLATAATAFRSLQDGVRAAQAGSLLIKVRFTHALERLFEELLGDFQSSLETAIESLAPGQEKLLLAEAGPRDSIRYFRLVLAEAEDLEGVPVRNEDASDILRYARRFVDRAETGQWEHLRGWSVSHHPMSAALSPEARAGLHLLEAWIRLRRLHLERVPVEIERALDAFREGRRTTPFADFREKSGRLHYYAGLARILPPDASMDELQKANLHFRDAWTDWDKADSSSQAARELLAQTYRRLARDHTEGNPLLRAHFEDQAFQAVFDLAPDLPEARVVRQRAEASSWLSRLWR